jgi:hypothetical protein
VYELTDGEKVIDEVMMLGRLILLSFHDSIIESMPTVEAGEEHRMKSVPDVVTWRMLNFYTVLAPLRRIIFLVVVY